jgi:hypothetical protein
MGRISEACPSDRFLLEAGVRLRPVPELGVCLAYTPARPDLHRLNAASWLIASLCDGRSLTSLEAAYSAALGRAGKTANPVTLRDGIDDLVELGVVRREVTEPAEWKEGTAP